MRGWYASPSLYLFQNKATDTEQVDGVKEYIDWAVGQNFGVMDVNIPGYVTHEEVCAYQLGLNILGSLD